MKDLSIYNNKYEVYLLASPSGKHYCGYFNNLKHKWR